MTKNSKRREIRRTRVEIPGPAPVFLKTVRETRGLRTVTVPISRVPLITDLAAQFTNETPESVYDKLRQAAKEILKENSLLESYPDADWSVDLALDWLASVRRRHGYTSPQTIAAEFWVNSDKLGEHGGIKITSRSVAAIFELCEAWHWLHMEVYGEHRKALDAQTAEDSRAKGPAAKHEHSLQRNEIISEVYRQHRLSEKRRSRIKTASTVAGDILPTVNTELRASGLATCTEGSLRKALGPIMRSFVPE
jgi:hypothetical protein